MIRVVAAVRSFWVFCGSTGSKSGEAVPPLQLQSLVSSDGEVNVRQQVILLIAACGSNEIYS